MLALSFTDGLKGMKLILVLPWMLNIAHAAAGEIYQGQQHFEC